MPQTLTLKTYHYDTFGNVHCGVTIDGAVVVAGVLRPLKDGAEAVFDRAQMRVTRKGDEYTFSRLNS